MTRTFVTYATASHVNYAAMSLYTLGLTQRDATAVVIVDDREDAGVRALAEGADAFGLPVRVVPLEEVAAHLDRARYEAIIAPFRDRLPSLDLVFSDTLRSALVVAFGGPVVWFDADMLFLGSIEHLLPPEDAAVPGAPLFDTPVLGVARDVLLDRDRGWRAAMDRFVAAVGVEEMPPERRAPANIGLLALGGDCREAYLDALERVLPVVCADPLEAMRFTVGQQAWNLVLWSQSCVWLDQTLNTPSATLGPIGAGDGALVRHYLGPAEKKRMTVDFVQGVLHAQWGGRR